jgi:molybdopterin-containing oxidoreductase family iron-sulfur binding subunit
MKITRNGFLRFLAAPLAAFQCKRMDAAPAKRWVMVVDNRKCMQDAGCNRCIQACHRAHNVPQIPGARHEVKWIWKERFRNLFGAETVPAAAQDRLALALCNHCENPPCARVCPTGATWRRADGIVMMDWHRCIGCRYCMAACPYGSRSFNWVDPRPYIAAPSAGFPRRTKGVVEKCNFCEERVGAGSPPLCVEACPEHALLFGDANDPQSEVSRVLQSRYAVRRHAELGTGPSVYYVI